MQSLPPFSIIIPCKTKKDLCPELLPAIKNQSHQNFETIIITDKICPGDPANKRNYATKKAKGKYLAFIDSDAYPHSDWLKNATKHLKPAHISAVCGPNLTPPQDNLYQKTSGLVWSSWLGAGGAGTYRNKISPPRFVTDFPSSNLIVKKSDFNKVKGFNTSFWPGEDTKLCHDLVYKLHKKILYHPSIQVFHHRRPIFIPHLKQISRFGFHRGLFARILPKTSLKPGYFAPLIFTHHSPHSLAHLLTPPHPNWPLPPLFPPSSYHPPHSPHLWPLLPQGFCFSHSSIDSKALFDCHKLGLFSSALKKLSLAFSISPICKYALPKLCIASAYLGLSSIARKK